jgi:hypothetical protein
MKIFWPFIMFVLLTGCAQNLIGTWRKQGYGGSVGMKFNNDGSFEVIDLKNPEHKALRNLNVKYELVKKNGKKYIKYSYFDKGALRDTLMVKYKLRNGILYLPSENEIYGAKKTNEFKDKYARVKP